MFVRKFLLAILLLTSSQVSAADLNISSVEVASMTTAHLCSRLGGVGVDPVITIHHNRVSGQTIRINMFDNVNRRTINHRATTTRSDGSGITRVTYNFLPPCNTTGRSTSNYKFRISSDGNSIIVPWARYDSARRKILQ